jgi:hypothetical protein
MTLFTVVLLVLLLLLLLLQSTFVFKGFDEVRRLGLRQETEAVVRLAKARTHGAPGVWHCCCCCSEGLLRRYSLLMSVCTHDAASVQDLQSQGHRLRGHNQTLGCIRACWKVQLGASMKFAQTMLPRHPCVFHCHLAIHAFVEVVQYLKGCAAPCSTYILCPAHRVLQMLAVRSCTL